MIKQKNGNQVFEYKIPQFLDNNVEISTKSDDYEILQVLTSTFSSVILKVKSKINKQIYAMKLVNMDKILNEFVIDKKYFENEIYFLQNLKSPYVCKCYTIFSEDKFLFFIMEFMNNGDLLSFYKANKVLENKIPEEKLWDIFYKSISGLIYIHEKGIIHRFIKLENLNLDDNFHIKITDFSVSATKDKKSAANFSEEEDVLENLVSQQTVVGDPGYMAPEVKKNERMMYIYSQKIDVYSMGVSFFELCYGTKPYQKESNSYYFDQKIYSYELNKIIEQMIEKDDKRRISSEDAYFIIRKNLINRYVKNSSIEAVLYCFYSFPNFRNFFYDNRNKLLINQRNNASQDNEEGDEYDKIEKVNYKEEIANNVFNVIQSLNKNNKEQIDDYLYELRKAMASVGLKAKENEEIDPGIFISFFLKILNSVLNEITNTDEQPHINMQDIFILSPKLKFSEGEEEKILKQFLRSYNKSTLSLISRNFISIIKIKKICKNPGCDHIDYSFSKFNFIPFNVDILVNKYKKINNLHLKDGFKCLLNDKIILDKDKFIHCSKCKDFTIHEESKKFYHTSKDLIIIFDRGEDFSNKTFIDFDEQLELNKTEVERYDQVKYNLVSILVKVETPKERKEFVCYMSSGNGNWVSNINKENSMSLDEVKKSGIIIALFYYSEDNNLILQSDIQQEMNNNMMIGNQGIQNQNNGNEVNTIGNNNIGVNNMNNNMGFNNMYNNTGYNNMNNNMGFNNMYNNTGFNNMNNNTGFNNMNNNMGFNYLSNNTEVNNIGFNNMNNNMIFNSTGFNNNTGFQIYGMGNNSNM